MGRVLDLLTGGRFDDFDFAEDDAFLDNAFSLDEMTLGAHGLVSAVPHGGRIPWDEILGTSVAYSPGWDKRGAPVMQPLAWMIHWTGSHPSLLRPAPDLWLVRDGRPAGKGVTAVPGPLANLYLDYRGRTTVLASGRANHAGLGDPAVDAAIRNGTLRAGKSGKSTTGAGGTLIGIEVANSGDPKQPLTPEQVRELVRLDRKIRDAYLWGTAPHHTLDHARRSSDRKIDLITARRQVPPLNYLAA